MTEADKKFWMKATGPIGGGNPQLDVMNFETTEDSKLAQNLIFDEVSSMVNLSMTSKDIDALTNFQEVLQQG